VAATTGSGDSGGTQVAARARFWEEFGRVNIRVRDKI
jgi:hypothetical protein